MKRQMQVWIAMMLMALTLSAGAATVDEGDNCVVATIGDRINANLGNELEDAIRARIYPTLQRYNLQCLTSVIDFGGLRRLSSFGAGNLLRGLLNRLCQAVLDRITFVPAEPAMPGTPNDVLIAFEPRSRDERKGP